MSFIPITKKRYAEFHKCLSEDLPEDVVVRVLDEFKKTTKFDPMWSRSTSDPDFWKRAYARKIENAKSQGLRYTDVYVKKIQK